MTNGTRTGLGVVVNPVRLPVRQCVRQVIGSVGVTFDPARFVVVLDTNLRAGSTTVLIPVNARTGGDRMIDWGDGTVTVENAANPTHTYASNGVYVVQMYGGTTTRLGNTGASPDAGWTQTLVSVIQWGKAIGWTSFQDGARGCVNNFGVPTDVPRTADGYAGNVTAMNSMFSGATAFNRDIGSWNTASVTTMSGMFFGATAFNRDIGSWNTAAVTTMASMLRDCTAFNQNIGSWNTAAVTNMSSMFSGCTAFNQDISGWNTAAVTAMNSMFSGATAFNRDIGSWNIAAVTAMSGMFNSSGLSTENYSRTLIGWANSVSSQGNLPASVTLGASGRTYHNTVYGGSPYDNAVDARAYLTSASPGPAWTITDGGQV